MEELIRQELSSYSRLDAERMILAHKLVNDPAADTKEQYDTVIKRINTLNAWLRLLTYDERFVVEKHLIEGLDWPRIASLYEKNWPGGFSRTERTLIKYQARACKRIAEFIEKHTEINLGLQLNHNI